MIGMYITCFLACFFVGLMVAHRRYRLRSTPTHLVFERKARALAPTPAETRHMDVTEVRRMEWELYGHYLTGLDGRPLDEDDPAAHVKDVPPTRTPLSPYDPLVHAPSEDKPCWCNFCKGQRGMHGAEAERQYREEARAAFAKADRRQVIQNVVAGGHVTQIVSSGRNITISGDAAGIIVTGDNDVVIQSGGRHDTNWDALSGFDYSAMSAELDRHLRRLGATIDDVHRKLGG